MIRTTAKIFIGASMLFAAQFSWAATSLSQSQASNQNQNQSQSQKLNQTQKRKGSNGVPAVIITDGALVYAAADENSTILAQLPHGQHVRISKGMTEGPQRFHKIIVGKKIGYIDDIDVSQNGASTPKRPPKRKKSAKDDDKPKSDDEKKRKAAEEKRRRIEEMKPRDPMYFTRFYGVEFGASQFKESISGVDSNTGLAVYGLKLTGPDLLFKGPVTELNLLIHYGAPAYYNTISTIQPTGFIILVDGLFVTPIKQWQNAMFYISFGPVLMYSKFDIVNGNRVMTLQDLGIGIDGAIGGGFRVGKVAIKLEGKYYLLKHPDEAALAAVQYAF